MNVLQQLNGNTLALLAVGLCGLCVVGLFLAFGVHIIAGIVAAFTHIATLIGHFISGGPGVWCGCLVAIGGCGLLMLLVWLITSSLATCSTSPTNFCALFGR